MTQRYLLDTNVISHIMQGRDTKLLARLVPIDQLHAAIGDKAAHGFQSLQARVVVEAHLLGTGFDQFAAQLVNHALEQPVIGPSVHIIRNTADIPTQGLDFSGQADQPVPGVGHVFRIAASAFNQVGVEVHDG